MPGYKGHTVGAVAAAGGYIATLRIVNEDLLQDTAQLLSDWQFLVGLMVLSVLFGLWPDVDTNSKGQNIFYGLAFVADIALIVTGRVEAAAFLGLLAMTPIIGKHRGWTHTILAMILVPAPLLIVPYLYRPEILQIALVLYGAAVAGYFSHLLLDGKVVRWFHVRGGR